MDPDWNGIPIAPAEEEAMNARRPADPHIEDGPTAQAAYRDAARRIARELARELTDDGFPRCAIVGHPCCCRGCKMRRQASETRALLGLQLVHHGERR